VQRLHPAVHHFRKAGDVGDVGDREAGIGEGARGAAGGDKLESAGGQTAPQVGDPGLVRNMSRALGIISKVSVSSLRRRAGLAP